MNAQETLTKNKFHIKTQSAYGIRQKHIERDRNVLESFNNTTVLSNMLRQPRKTFASGLLGISSGKEKLKQAIESKLKEETQGLSYDELKLEELKSEVKALPDHPRTDNNMRTYNMLMEQKRRRRENHNSELEDFEGMRKELLDTNDAEKNRIKTDVDQFLQEIDTQMNNYFEQ